MGRLKRHQTKATECILLGSRFGFFLFVFQGFFKQLLIFCQPDFYFVCLMEEQLKIAQWLFLRIQWPEQWELQASLQW